MIGTAILGLGLPSRQASERGNTSKRDPELAYPGFQLGGGRVSFGPKMVNESDSRSSVPRWHMFVGVGVGVAKAGGDGKSLQGHQRLTVAEEDGLHQVEVGHAHFVERKEVRDPTGGSGRGVGRTVGAKRAAGGYWG